MSKVGKRVLAASKEALAIARGEQPAASITIGGHTYVPKVEFARLERENAELRAALEKLLTLVVFELGENQEREPWKRNIARARAALRRPA